MRALNGRVLTIAGSDSGGGAGIQADIKTCTALGCYAMTAITAITAQNTCGVDAIFEVPATHVQAQIAAVYADIKIDAVKTGMLANASIVETTAQFLKEKEIVNLVVDPVMISKSGASLLKADAIEALKKTLLPIADLVCPNVPEAEKLTGIEIRGEQDIETALKLLYALGPRNVLLKGGHLESPHANDYLYNGKEIRVFAAPRISTVHTHGTGCTYSAAIACFMAMQENIPSAVQLAKDYMTGAILHSENLHVGKGTGPLHHGWNIEINLEKR